MAADFFIGESLVGDGNEVAHIDLIIGSKSGPAGQAFVNALANQREGHSTLLAVVSPNLPAKPDALLFNKVTIKGATQAVQMFGPAQAAVARAVVGSCGRGAVALPPLDRFLPVRDLGARTPMRKLLLQLDSSRLPSVFDRVVAYDGAADEVMSYGGIAEADVRDLIHGCIFTRGPKDLKNTAVFVGGADIAVGEQLLGAATKAMFKPFTVSAMLDSNGSNTTAVAAVAKMVKVAGDVRGKRVLIVAGTGPVGIRAAALLAKAGADVCITSRKADAGERARDLVLKRFGGKVRAIAMPDASEAVRACERAELLLNAGPAGVMLVPRQAWANRPGLEVVADVNAVPPLGVEGVDVMDDGVTKEGVVCFGALAIGNLKMKVHKACIARLFERNDLVLDAETIADVARELMAPKS